MRLVFLLLTLLCTSCNYEGISLPGVPGHHSTPDPPPTSIPVYTYTVVNTFLHDPAAFTQGLVYTDGMLYEGTGLPGQSSLRKVDLTTGEVLQQRTIPAAYFGEGIAIFNDRIYQLTWQSHTCLVYNLATFEPVAQFAYPTEGWGLTHDGTHLIMSDGSATLYFRDPDTFSETGRITVTDTAGPIRHLNELEYINGEIYANVWQTDRIARIDPKTGVVTAWIDLTGILPPSDRANRVDVLNGIAHDAKQNHLLVTGKWWPKLFEIRLVKSP